MAGKRSKIRLARVPVDVLDGMRRVMPDHEGFTNPMRFRLLFKMSAVNIEDFLNGRKPKKFRKKR